MDNSLGYFLVDFLYESNEGSDSIVVSQVVKKDDNWGNLVKNAPVVENYRCVGFFADMIPVDYDPTKHSIQKKKL